MRDMKVKEIMTRLFVALKPTDSIHYAARRLAQNHISGAPVIENDRVVGVISESDIIRATYPSKRGIVTNFLDAAANLNHEAATHLLRGRTVADAMSSPAITVSPAMSVWEAAALTERSGVKRLPVVNEDGWLVGVVSRADLVRVMGRSDEALEQDLVDTISVLGEDLEGLDVSVVDGVATLSGRVDRKRTQRIVLGLARRTPGVVDVVDRLIFEVDDEHLKWPQRSHPHDPWATGPLVRER
jgi:CBS domain-containing protein